MKRALRWTVRLVGIAVVLAAVLIIVLALALPGFVERSILAQLDAAGLGGSALRVDSIRPDRATISDLGLGADRRLTVDHATATYTLRGAAGGVFDTLRLSGAQLRVAVREGTIDLGSLAEVEGEGKGPFDPPFRRLELRHSSVLIELPDRTMRVHVSGAVNRIGEAAIGVELALDGLGQRLTLTGVCRFEPGRTVAEEVRLTLVPADYPLMSGAIRWAGLEADMSFALTPAENGFDISLPEPAVVHLASAVLPNEAGDLTAPATVWRIEHDGDGPLARVPTDGRSPLHIAARIVAATAVELVSDDLRVSIPRVEGRFALGQVGEERPGLRGLLEIRDASVRYEPAELAVASITAQVPIGVFAEPPAVERFATGPIRVGADELPPIRGEALLTEQWLSLTADWPLVEGFEPRIAGTVGADGAELTVRADPVRIRDDRALGRRFSALRDLEVDGTFGLDARFGYRNGRLEPRITLGMADANLRSREWDASARGVTGEVTINSLAPLTTPGSQRLRIAEVESGEIEFTDANIAFRLESARHVFLERVAWTLGETGRLTVHAVRWDLDQPDPVIETEVFVDRLNVGDWLSTLTDERIQATGELYGRLPVAFRPERSRKLEFGEGFLYAPPGAGEMRIADARRVGELLEEADPRFAADQPLGRVREQAVNALVDFEYSMFRFDLIREGDTMTLRAETRGRGRRDGQEIGSLVVNLRNFDDLVNHVMFTRLTTDRAIDRLLERATGR